MNEDTNKEILASLQRIEVALETFTKYIGKAESEVPEYLRRLTMYYHDLVHIKWAWEQIGQQMDTTQAKELERTHHRMSEILDEERGQGGTFHKHIKRMEQKK